MPRLIDGDALQEEYVRLSGRELSLIDSTPTVDAVEVVRCKDCKRYYADPWGYGNCVFEGGVSRRTKDSDFCSWGEKREDKTDKLTDKLTDKVTSEVTQCTTLT